jgi:hypothetical protein
MKQEGQSVTTVVYGTGRSAYTTVRSSGWCTVALPGVLERLIDE